MNRNRTHPLRSSPLRLQRSRVDSLVPPPPIDLNFINSNEYSFQNSSSYTAFLTPYKAGSVALYQATSYSVSKSGPGFINSNGLIRMRSALPSEPRFEFLSPTIGAPVRPLGLNIDVDNYNYLENSRTMATGVGTYQWVATNITGAGTLNATGPDGTTSAITLTATVSDGTITQARGNTGIGAGAKMFSVWLKRKTGSNPIRIKLAGTTYTVVSVTGEWQRFSITGSGTTPSPGIQIANASDEIYVYCPQLSKALNQILTPPNEVIGSAADLQVGPDLLQLNVNTNAGLITGEVGTYFIEIDMSDRGGTSQYAQASFNMSDGADQYWTIDIERNPLSPATDYVQLSLSSGNLGGWYSEFLQQGNLNSLLRIAFSWNTRTPDGTVSAAMWNDTTYPFGIPTLTETSTEITSLNDIDPSWTLDNGRIFYVRKFKVWNEYKSPQELQMIVTNG
jgi:hypothetical protein